MSGRFDKKNLVKNDIKVSFRQEVRMRKYLLEVENGKVVETGVRSANDVVSRFFEEGSDFADPFKYFGIHIVRRRMFPIQFGIVLVGQRATQVLVFKNPALVKKIKGRDIGSVLLHPYDGGEFIVHEILGVVGRGSEMHNANIFVNEIVKLHDVSVKKGLMNGLRFLESDLIFVNDDENIVQMLDLVSEKMQLVSVKDRVMVLLREASTRLFHPVHRGETGNDESMIVWNLLNGA